MLHTAYYNAIHRITIQMDNIKDLSCFEIWTYNFYLFEIVLPLILNFNQNVFIGKQLSNL